LLVSSALFAAAGGRVLVFFACGDAFAVGCGFGATGGGGFDGAGFGIAATIVRDDGAAGGAFGVTAGGGRDGGGMDGVESSAAAFASSSARESFSASEAASAARRNHFNASTRSPRAH
jgi:hypothetical protein